MTPSTMLSHGAPPRTRRVAWCAALVVIASACVGRERVVRNPAMAAMSTPRVIAELKKPLTIEIHAARVAEVEGELANLEQLIDRYSDASHGKVVKRVVRFDGAAWTTEKAAARKDPAATVPLEEIRVDGLLGVMLAYGPNRYLLDGANGLSTDLAATNRSLGHVIRELYDRDEKIVHRIGWVTGHGERGLDAFAKYLAEKHPFFVVENVELAKGDVDGAIEGLFVTSPQTALDEKEVARLERYLVSGRPVAVFANAVRIAPSDPSMNATIGDLGLEKWLATHGIDGGRDLLIDKAQFWTPKVGSIALDPYPLVFLSGGATRTFTTEDFAPFRGVGRLLVPIPTELRFDASRAGGAHMRPVIETTGRIIRVQGTTISTHPSRERMGNGATGQQEEQRKAVIGLALEGPFRLLVVSSGAFFDNVFETAGKSPFGGMMPGMDPNLGADEELLRYGQLYEPLRSSSPLVAKQTCDWFVEP